MQEVQVDQLLHFQGLRRNIFNNLYEVTERERESMNSTQVNINQFAFLTKVSEGEQKINSNSKSSKLVLNGGIYLDAKFSFIIMKAKQMEFVKNRN